MILRFSKSFVLVILLFACVQPVEISTDRTGGSVIISGQLSNLPEQSVVFVGITADTERLPYPVSGVVVNLFQDNLFINTLSEDQSNPGNYILDDSLGVAGKTYHIEVILPDGRIYESTPEKMPDDSGAVNSYYEIVKDEEFVDYEGILVKQPVVKIFANGILPSSTNRFIRWTVDEVFILIEVQSGPMTPPPCFVTQLADPQSIILLDRQFLSANEFPSQLAATRIADYSFEYTHYFVTYQSALTQEAYNYWRKVEALVGQTGSLFDTPPAIISGNISNTSDRSERVFGYFEATHQTLNRIKLTIEDFPFRLHYTDCSGPSGGRPLRCSNCLSVRNSSHIRPPWF